MILSTSTRSACSQTKKDSRFAPSRLLIPLPTASPLLTAPSAYPPPPGPTPSPSDHCPPLPTPSAHQEFQLMQLVDNLSQSLFPYNFVRYLLDQLTGTPLSRRLCHSSERWRRVDHRSLRCCTSFRMLRFIFEDTWSPFPFFSLFSSLSISPPRETIQVNHISRISHHMLEIFYCAKVLNVCISSPERNPIWVVLRH